MAVKENKFQKLRDVHHREKAEDYVEMIQEIEREMGEVRLTDLAHRFGVSSVTAHKILSRLQREEFVTSRPYRAIYLTPKGKKLAGTSHHRHKIVYDFLKKLGVPEETAQMDAEGIEHHVSPETLEIFKRYLREKGK